MIRQFLAGAFTLCTSSIVLAGDYPFGSDYIAWPADTPSGLTKLVGANITPDDFDDAIALHGTSLYLVHAPAMFPRWQLLATGVTDFVMVHRGAITEPGIVMFSDSTGLRLATWSSGAAQVNSLAGTTLWANATQLCAVADATGTAVAAVAPGNRVRRGRWGLNGVWTNGALIAEQGAITSLALANYSSTTGVEQACVAAGALKIRTEAGGLLPNTGVVTTAPHKVFRVADGGNALDSFLYVAASSLGAPYQEVIQEVFHDGASLPIESGLWIVRSVSTNRPWIDGKRCVTIQAANYGDVFRFHDSGYTPNTTTFSIPQPGPEEETYWNITVTAEQSAGAPVTDGAMAVADFDADGRDDVLVASPDQRHTYFFPAAATADRFNQLRVLERDDTLGSGGGGVLPHINMDTSVVIHATPQGITGGPANGVACVWWVRDGLESTIDPLTAMSNVVQATPGIPVLLPIGVDVPDVETGLIYLQFRAVRATFSPTAPPVVHERGAPLNCVTMFDQYDPLLCTLFDEEPDRWSDDNRVLNECVEPDVFPGAPLLSGFNRRSTIGPFSGGAGAPPGGN